MRPPNNLENKIPTDTYWTVQFVSIKAQTYTSLEQLLEYSQDQTPWTNWGWS